MSVLCFGDKCVPLRKNNIFELYIQKLHKLIFILRSKKNTVEYCRIFQKCT